MPEQETLLRCSDTVPQLADRIGSALKGSPHIPNSKLRFEANDGRVVLRGSVGSYYQKQMAQEVVRTLDGVDQIENHLEAVWT